MYEGKLVPRDLRYTCLLCLVGMCKTDTFRDDLIFNKLVMGLCTSWPTYC